MAPLARPARATAAELHRYAHILGATLAVVVVAMAVAVPVLGATSGEAQESAPPAWWDTFSIVTAGGLARVLTVVTVVTWLAAEAVFGGTSAGFRWRPTPAKALAVGALLIGAWVASACAYVVSPCQYDAPCVPIPWPGPHVPFSHTNPPVDLAVPPELWPPSVLHVDVDVAVGPVLILVALAVALYGARSTGSRTLRRTRTSPLATRSAVALVGVFVIVGLAGVVALTIAVADPDAFPRYTAITDLRLWGVLGVVVGGFLISGRRRTDSALLVAVVLAQEWGAVQLWLSGESYAHLGHAVAAVATVAVATAWHPLAVALDALIGARPAPGRLDTDDTQRAGSEPAGSDPAGPEPAH